MTDSSNCQRGLAISPGVALGPVYFLESQVTEVPRRTLSEAAVEVEAMRLRSALQEAQEELTRQRDELSDELSESDKLIFDAHLEFYRDEVFREAIEQRIRASRLNAEAAIQDQVDHLVKALSGMDSTFRDRVADIRDVGRRLHRLLLRHEQEILEGGGKPFILYAHELLPSDTMAVDRKRLLGIVTEVGGEASHVAILARAFGIPAVSGIRALEGKAGPGTELAVDGNQGSVLVAPTDQQKRDLVQARDSYLTERQRLAADAVAATRAEAETGVELLLNIENFYGLNWDLLNTTRGIGLYRTEFLFMGRSTFPSEEEQYEFYRGVLEQVGDLEVTFRTIDVGGDKPLEYLTIPREQNPVLGWRGIRISFEWPDLLIPQLRALLRASAHGRLKILLPMVTHLEELREARGLLDGLREDLIREGQALADAVPLGAMIEVPSAAVAAADLAAEADFLSVGTNDLGQYLFAVDRNNLQVSRFYQPLHPTMLRVLDGVIAAGAAADCPVTVCGEMAGQPLSVVALLALGLKRFSMSPSHVPEVRWVFQHFRSASAAELKDRILALKTNAEVVELLKGTLHDLPGAAGVSLLRR